MQQDTISDCAQPPSQQQPSPKVQLRAKNTKQHSICTCLNIHCQQQTSITEWSTEHNLPIIPIVFENIKLEALLDSGSQIPLVSDIIYQQIKDSKFRIEQLQAFSCNGTQLDIPGIVTGSLQLHQKDAPITAEFYILKQSTQQCILPHTWLAKLKATLNWESQTLTYELPPKNCILRANGDLEVISEAQPTVTSISLTNKQPIKIPPYAQTSLVLPYKESLPKLFQVETCQGFSRPNKPRTKHIISILNHTSKSVTIPPNMVISTHPIPNTKVLPTNIRPRRVAHVTSYSGSANKHDHEFQEQNILQSQFDHSSKSLVNVPVSQQKISFNLPSPMQSYPFDPNSDPITILYVYVIYLIGTSLQYHTKTPEELGFLIEQLGNNNHKKLYRRIGKQFDKSQIQAMYMNTSLHIVYRIHHCFQEYHQKHDTAKNTTAKGRYKREAVLLNAQMVNDIQILIALYFLNQSLIHKFYCDTLQHPYFRKLEIPVTLQETIHNLQQSVQTNAIQIPTPCRSLSQQSLDSTLTQNTAPYVPQQLNFRQYNDALQQTCHSYTQQYNQNLSSHTSPYKSPPKTISEVQPNDLPKFINYSKSQQRLADFLTEQLPNNTYSESTQTVSEILDNMPIPKWVYYSSVSEIIEDYIPSCLMPQFEEFYIHFSDPVFVKLSGMHALPFPPTEALLSQDPPDPLHANNGLVDPKTLAATACQFLTDNHIILQPPFKRELTLLACVLFIFGQTGLSLHALDTGKFKQAFEVKTILAATAPTSSHPPRQATETVTLDLDERLEFLKKQGKVAEILGSPYLAQLSSVPKNYKTSKVFTSEKLDPVLKYITQLPNQTKHLLAEQSQEVTKKQHQLIEHLNMEPPTNVPVTAAKIPKQQPIPENLDSPDPSQSTSISVNLVIPASTKPLVTARPLLKDSLLQLTIKDAKTKEVLFVSTTPPTHKDQNYFHQTLHGRTAQKLQIPKVKFSFDLILSTDDSSDLREYRKRVPYSKHHREYFATTQDFNTHQNRQICQSVALKSKTLLTEGPHSQAFTHYKNSREQRTPIKYITRHFPNVAQLAKHKLHHSIADHQQYLAVCNNINFAISQFSAQTPLNKFVDAGNPTYDMMHQLALNPQYLAQAQAQNPTNLAPQQLIKHCLHITQDVPTNFNKLRFQYIEKKLARIHIQTHNTQKFNKLISLLNTSMRQIDHKRALKTTHSLKQNTIEILSKLQPQLQDKWDKVSIQEVLKTYSGWPELIQKIAQHYQIPVIWLELQVIQNKQLFHNPKIVAINIEEPCLYNQHLPAFAVVAYNPTSSEFYGVRPNISSIKLLLQASHSKQICSKITLAEALQHITSPQQPTQNEPEQTNQAMSDKPHRPTENHPAEVHHKPQNAEETPRPRFTKLAYPHINKSFYQKNAITRFILNSRDTNKLTRPTDTHMQSQSSIINNLGSSHMFSNYDLTSAFDAVPACPISSLINTASYRNKEYSLLIASMGGSNSVLFCQRAVTSLLHQVHDQLLLRPCFKPNPIQGLNPDLEQQIESDNITPSRKGTVQFTTEESWSGCPLLHLKAPKLIKQIQHNLMYGARDLSQNHNLPMSAETRDQLLRKKTEDTFLSTSALIDDVVCSSKPINTPEYHSLSSEEQTRVHLQIHIHILLTLFQAINTLSQNPGPGPTNFKATLKLKLEKSCFATTSIKYLNLIYIKGFQVINTDNFKKSCKYLDTLPSHGDELRSAIGFTNYLLSFTKSLRYLLRNLETLAAKHPAKKAIQWDKYPEQKQEYQLLCQTIKASNCLHTLPSDLNQIDKVVFNTDACSASTSYCVAFSLKPVPSNDKISYLKLLRYYSAKLPDYCTNLTILLKETIAAVLCLIQEATLLKILPPGCTKYLIIDSKPLFDLLNKYLSNGQLNALFAAHASIPLWISRLYQFITAHSITLLLVPTKLNTSADFLTRKVHSIVACKGTNKRVPCDLCPGCKSHCIRSTSHTGCPYAIGASGNEPPRLISFDTITHHSVELDCSKIPFQSVQTAFNPAEYIEYDLAKPLEVLGSSSTLSPNPQEISSLYEDPLEADGDGMLNKVHTQIALLDETIQAVQSLHHQSHPSKTSTRANIAAATITQPEQNRMLPIIPNHTYIYTDYTKNRPLHSLKIPLNTAVVHFTTQKKSWNKTNEYFSRILAQTAIARMDFNIGQVETVQIDNTTYIVLCADVSPTPPYLTPDTLFTNIHICLRKLSNLPFTAQTVLFDYESIRKLYEIPPITLVKALSLVTDDNSVNPYQYEVYSYNPATPAHLTAHQLQLTIPVIHNQLRKGIISISIELSHSLKDILDSLITEVSTLVSTVQLATTKTAIIYNHNIIPFINPCPLTGAQCLLVKDHNYRPQPEPNIYFAQHNNKPLLVIRTDSDTNLLWAKFGATQAWMLWNASHTVQGELQAITNCTYTAFQMTRCTPLATKLYKYVLYFDSPDSPKLSTQMPVADFTELLFEYPTKTKLNFFTTTGINNVSINTPVKSSQHILQHLLEAHTSTLLAQAADPKVQELILRTKRSEGPLIIQQCAFNIFDNILFGKHLSPTQNVPTNTAFRPVISQSQLIPEILQTHRRLKCAPAQKVQHDINTRYFHQVSITSDIGLEPLIKNFIPCHICILGRAAHITAPLYLKMQSIGLEALGIKNCNLISNDVFYLSKGPNTLFKDPYISVIVCNSCRFISLQPIAEINSTNLASHILEFCQITGKIPHIVISDAASTQTGSEMRKLLSDFFIIHMTANQQSLSRSKELPHPTKTTDTPNRPNQEQQLFPDSKDNTILLDQLTENQKSLLLQDVQRSNPSLYNTIFTHHPASYKASQSNRETSLGSLDNVCKRLKIFLQKFLLDVPTDSNQHEHVQQLIKSFVYLNNFKYKAAFTKQVPAILHLGLLRYTTIDSMMTNVSALTDPTSKPVGTLQQILRYAENFRQAETNAQDFQNQQQERQLKQHGRLLTQETFEENFTPFTVLFAKTEFDSAPKLHTYTQFIGPYVLISTNPNSNTIYLYSLLTAEVHKTSYRHVRQAFNTNTVFSTPLFGLLGDNLQFNYAEKLAHLHRKPTAEQITSDIQKILVNLHKLIMFVAPILPNTIETQKAITLTLEEADQEPKTQEYSSDAKETTETYEKEEENTNTNKTVKFTFHGDQSDSLIKDITHSPRQSKQIPIDAPANLSTKPLEVPTQIQTDEPFLTRSEQIAQDTTQEDMPRPMKYALRRSPKPNPKYS